MSNEEVPNEEGRADIVNAIKNKLQDHTAKKLSYVLYRLSPLVRKRVEVLMEFQCEHDELEVQFFEERAVLEAKYQKLYQPLYTKRYEIVNGVVEVEETATDTAKIQEGEESSEEKGVPDFWLTAMKHNEITAEEIYAHDKGALKFLKDIKCSMIDDPKGFKLEFFFNSNPYFKNSVLTKTYQLIDEDDPVLEEPIGTEIEWHTGKCLTQKNIRKNPKKGSNMRIPKTVQCESFFNFFSPPEVPYDDDEDHVKALRHLMEEDYYVGLAIKYQIIPHAVSWFTGDALKGLVEYYDDEDDDEESEDDQDADSEEKYHLKNRKKNKIQDYTGKHSSFVLDRLSPLVRKRIEVLREFQCEHDELEVQFFEERAVLEAKYHKLYQPLYTKRYEIVNGVVEVEETATDAAKIQEGEESSEEKGVPDFWLSAMGFNMFTGREMSYDDGGALKFLKDIKWSRIDDPKGFKLEFFFDPNPYFKNSVLTKTYHLIDEDEHIPEKAIGTEIEWHTGKCLTQKIVRQKPEKGSYTRNSKTVQCKSFFRFFSPPEVPENDDEDEAELLHNLMEQDYDIGFAIKDKLIPHAVSWFTGDALRGFVESDDDEDDEEDAYSEEEEYHPKYRKKKSRRAAAGVGRQGKRFVGSITENPKPQEKNLISTSFRC